MPDVDKLTPADPSDLASALAFALRFHGRKRVHNADDLMAEIVARRLIEHLERAGFVVMKRPAEIGPRRSGAVSRASARLLVRETEATDAILRPAARR